MTRFLIFIRHSKVVKDPTIPSHTWQLSEDGRSLCLDLLPQITSYQPAIFVTSTENKARKTGRIIADALNTPCHDAPGLQEHDRTGTPYFEDAEEFRTAVSTLFAHPDKLVFGQETANQAYTRFNHAVDA
ncbi:MAG: histidine phosphatase family protein, partial [Chloroflexi bacterium]|nr:histidine phosphatase family protein [Chloroflexota bacterium]